MPLALSLPRTQERERPQTRARLLLQLEREDNRKAIAKALLKCCEATAKREALDKAEAFAIADGYNLSERAYGASRQRSVAQIGEATIIDRSRSSKARSI